jgi:transglutaminase-like putative cysteine protease
MNQSLEACLQPTPIIDSNHPEVAAYAASKAEGAHSDLEAAIQLYYAVRDDIRYDPYSAVVTVDGLKASRALALRRAWCVPKAALLTACCRVLGIPARVGFADVRNHLSTARMREHMQTEVFHWHGYSAIYLGGSWLKATPAYNLTL